MLEVIQALGLLHMLQCLIGLGLVHSALHCLGLALRCEGMLCVLNGLGTFLLDLVLIQFDKHRGLRPLLTIVENGLLALLHLL